MSQEQQSKALAPLNQHIAREQKRLLSVMIKRHQEDLMKLRRPQTAAEYAKEFEAGRNWLKTDNYLVWLKGRRKRGIYASWKDDNFLKWTLKECLRPRTMPWLGGGIVTYFLFRRAFAFGSKEDAKASPNLFPYGYPPGSELPHSVTDIVSMDMPKLPLHTAPRQQGLPHKTN